MMILIGIIIAIIIFSIIILIHEYGHFKAARFFGVKVEEFGLGIPPKAKKLFTDKYGTNYTLNWLPLGGFVKMKGENINTFNLYDKKQKLHNNESLEIAIQNNEDVYDSKNEKIQELEKKEILKQLNDNYSNDSLMSKSSWKQAIVVLAGVFMNFVLAIFIFAILFMIGVSPIGVNNKIETDIELRLIPTLDQAIEKGIIINKPGIYLLPIEDSISKQSGIKDYDLVIKVNDNEINSQDELKEIISNSPLEKINFELKRSLDDCNIRTSIDCEFEKITKQIIPNEEGLIGSYLIPNMIIDDNFKYKYGFFGSLKAGTEETISQIRFTFKALGMILQKIFAPETPQERQEAIEQVAGPVGMVDFMSRSYSNGIIFLLIFGAIISVNLGVFNLLPIPALDGGRFIFITINGTIQKIFGRKAINEKLEGTIHVFFFIFLIALSVLIAYNDITRIIER